MTADPGTSERTHRYFTRSPREVAQSLGVDPDAGLTSDEAERRLREHGPNELPTRDAPSLPTIVLAQLRDPLIVLLLAATAAASAIGSFANAGFILAVVVFNTVIGSVQGYSAERSAAALHAVLARETTVRRAGQRERIRVTSVVPGDIVVLEAGMSVPTDARLLESRGLRVDESTLTGESVPVEKDPDAELDAGTPLPERVTMVHAGTSITGGRGAAIVTATGAETSLGEIAESVAEQGGKPPLVVRIERFTRQIAIATLALVGILAALQFARGDDLQDVFFLAIALTVSAIPAGLPAAITVALAIASRRMAERRVIARTLPAVEGLGTTTLIATDKTGTLTENRLTIRCLVLGDGTEVEVPGGPLDVEVDDAPEVTDAIRDLVVAGVLASEAELHIDDDGRVQAVGDRVDAAFLVLARKLALDERDIRDDAEHEARIPYESARQYAASFDRTNGRRTASVKGAPERIAAMCETIERSRAHELEGRLASRGYRVLAVASGPPAAEAPTEDSLRGLRFVGLVGLIDPVRAGVPASVDRCHQAGVEVRMVTGDHPSTALAIARDIGIAEDRSQVVTGGELDELGADASARMAEVAVFARVEPSRKAEIVEVLEDRGHYLAVTGDGVNDAPALRRANIGVAMGEGGTDVARDVADLILTDDNFSSIVNGIEEGRTAYDNVRKVTWLLIATAIGEVMLFFLALASGKPLPLIPVQLLWLNLVTNGIQDVCLGFEGREPGILDRPPRDPDQPLFDRTLVEESLVSGVTIGLLTFGTFTVLWDVLDLSLFETRNLTLLLLVLLENAHALSCRSERRSILSVPLAANRLLVFGILLAQGVHIAALYTPGLSDVLEIEPVSVIRYALLLPITLVLVAVDELHKRLAHADVRQARSGGAEP